MGSRDEQDSSELRVVDKRRFTSEGEMRQEAGGGSASAVPQEPRQSQTIVSTKAPAPEAEASTGGRNQSLPAVDFSSFVVSLATQALVMLGEIPNPESNSRTFQRDAAQHTIDIIAMLEEKSSGNLTEDESNLIGEVLSSLRLAFVKKVKEHEKF